PHVDPFGSIVLPVLGALTHVPVIGWAKPVPVDPSRLRNRRRDMLIVSLAGPTTNFVLAAIAALVARWQFHSVHGDFFTLGDLPMRVLVPLLFAEVNLFLGIFNFLPIPPLAARRRVAGRAGAARDVASRLVQVPALRDPRAVPLGVQHRHPEQHLPAVPRPPVPVRPLIARVRHLVTRFFGSLRPRPLDPD